VSDYLGLNKNKTPAISTPYDLVHLTHVSFNRATGEFTGLPKGWRELLGESGITGREQETFQEGVMDVVRFYLEGRADVWDGTSAPPVPPRDETVPPDCPQRPVSPLNLWRIGSSMTCSRTEQLSIYPILIELIADQRLWTRQSHLLEPAS